MFWQIAKKFRDGGYLTRVPTDGWKNKLRYICPGANGGFDLSSLGADGLPGGVHQVVLKHDQWPDRDLGEIDFRETRQIVVRGDGSP